MLTPMRHAVLVGCLLACGHRSEPNVCDVVMRDPAHAMEHVGGDPVQAEKTIEDCIAPPGGDECERLARIVTAIPSMLPGAPAQDADTARRVCRAAPAAVRPCLFPSYLLAHGDECKKLRDQLAAAPRPAPPAANCGAVSIAVVPAGIWLGINDTTRCFGKRRGTALDTDWLEAELRPLTKRDCRPAVELAGEASASYQELITVMDVAVKVGLVDIGLSSETPVAFAKLDPATATVHCAAGAPKVANEVGPAVAAAGSNALASAPVVVITKTQITVQGKDVISTADAAKQPDLEALVHALPHAPGGLIILQADQTTSAVVIDHVVKTLKRAGYDNVLFAVKNR